MSKKLVTISMEVATAAPRPSTHITTGYDKPGRAETICGLDTILFTCNMTYEDKPLDCPACLKIWRRCREVSPALVDRGR